MGEKTFEGIYPYIVSPVGKDGEVLEKPLRRLVSHLISCGIQGLTPLGSTGEFYYLTWEQKKRIVEIVLDENRGRVPVVAGVASSNTLEACSQAKELEAMGADGILSILNVYFPVKPGEVEDYYRSVARSVNCPVVLYNNPKFMKFDLGIDTLESLCLEPNIQYYKDATGVTGNLLSIRRRLGDRLKIFSASAHIPVFVMMLGGVGWMAGPACVIPRQSVHLYQLCRDGKWEEALTYQGKLWDINRVFQKYNLASCIKACLEIQGFEVGDPILPVKPVNDQGKEELKKVLAELEKI
ncbi:MAG: dihydrodipicolinate synthase family protein [Enterocloster sp.]